MQGIKFLYAVPLIMVTGYSFSQNADSTSSRNKDFNVKGSVTVTNKGISYIPNFSLGKPAAIFDLSLAGKRLAFEPQLRFSLNGEPWSFLFSVRYKIKSAGRFQLSAGLNPLLNFKNVTYIANGVSITDLVNRRYLGGEIRPTYFITKNISAGAYYLYFRGVSDRTLENTHFVALNTAFSNIKLGNSFLGRFSNQFYYLNQDGFDGVYINPGFALQKKDFPFSIQSVMNAVIHTNIPGSEKFIWNLSLVYAFNQTYTRKQGR